MGQPACLRVKSVITLSSLSGRYFIKSSNRTFSLAHSFSDSWVWILCTNTILIFLRYLRSDRSEEKLTSPESNKKLRTESQITKDTPVPYYSLSPLNYLP